VIVIFFDARTAAGKTKLKAIGEREIRPAIAVYGFYSFGLVT
jgi:hypothetical protein